MDTLQYKLTLEETNIILKALGELPYSQVTSLIQNIRQQAEQQLQQTSIEDTEKTTVPVKSKNGKQLNGKHETVA